MIEPNPAPNIADASNSTFQNDTSHNDPTVHNEIIETIAETNVADGRPTICIAYDHTTPTYYQQEQWPITEHTNINTPSTDGHQLNLTSSPFYPLATNERDRYQRVSTNRIMRRAMCHAQPAIASYRLHLDGGANMSLTNDETKLINFRHIKKHAIAGVADGAPALHATGIGYLPWRSDHGRTILIKCYYSHQAAETVISPNDVVLNHITDFSGWTQYSNVDEGKGYIAFHHRGSNQQTTFRLECQNGLW